MRQVEYEIRFVDPVYETDRTWVYSYPTCFLPFNEALAVLRSMTVPAFLVKVILEHGSRQERLLYSLWQDADGKLTLS